MQTIKNVVLDLGGVLLNLSFAKTEAAFARLGIDNFNHHYSQFKSAPLFEELEMGTVDKTAFLEHFKNETGVSATDEEIISAWNEMLLDFPEERIKWLSDLSARYRVFLFSNTNAFHYDSFQKSFTAAFPEKEFDQYFEKAYYSHLLGKRKPAVSAFLALLEDAGLEAAETLFIDDTLNNIEGAREAGLQVIHLTNGTTVLELPI